MNVISVFAPVTPVCNYCNVFPVFDSAPMMPFTDVTAVKIRLQIQLQKAFFSTLRSCSSIQYCLRFSQAIRAEIQLFHALLYCLRVLSTMRPCRIHWQISTPGHSVLARVRSTKPSASRMPGGAINRRPSNDTLTPRSHSAVYSGMLCTGVTPDHCKRLPSPHEAVCKSRRCIVTSLEARAEEA